MLTYESDKDASVKVYLCTNDAYNQAKYKGRINKVDQDNLADPDNIGKPYRANEAVVVGRLSGSK